MVNSCIELFTNGIAPPSVPLRISLHYISGARNESVAVRMAVSALHTHTACVWRIVIQDTGTGKYLARSDAWVIEQREARAFERVHLAAERCAKLKLKGLRVIVGIPGEDGRLTSCMVLQPLPPRQRRSRGLQETALSRSFPAALRP